MPVQSPSIQPLQLARQACSTRAVPRAVALVGLLSAITLPALAHTGADGAAHHGLLDGLLHPLTGLDHLAAMLAVGAWSALVLRPTWLGPLAFVLMLVCGALLGAAGVAVPAVEPMIAASVLVMGLLICARQSLPVAAAVALVGTFAVFHGVAHGAELAGGDTAWSLVGMLASTAALHLVGMALGHFGQARSLWLARSLGCAVAGLGVYMLAALA
jgi:urease accessory protein